MSRPSRGGAGLAIGLVLGCATACASIEVVTPEHLNGQPLTEQGTTVAHITAANWGIYLFKWIPIATGNLDEPGRRRWPVFFRDNVTVEDVVDELTETSRGLGATRTLDLQSIDKSEWKAWSLFFWLNEVEATANAAR